MTELSSEYSKTSLNQPTMRETLNGPFKEVVGLGSQNIVTLVLYGRSFGTQIKQSIQWSIGEGGQLERFDCMLHFVCVYFFPSYRLLEIAGILYKSSMINVSLSAITFILAHTLQCIVMYNALCEYKGVEGNYLLPYYYYYYYYYYIL